MRRNPYNDCLKHFEIYKPYSKHFLVLKDSYVTRENALDHSIVKWAIIYAVVKKGKVSSFSDGASSSCALCISYHWCDDCPIALKTGSHQCRGTGYYAIRRRLEDILANKDELENLITEELDLLCSLADKPEGETERVIKWILRSYSKISES